MQGKRSNKCPRTGLNLDEVVTVTAWYHPTPSDLEQLNILLGGYKKFECINQNDMTLWIV